LDKLRRGECDLDNAVEEILRYEPPIYQMCRTAVDDVVFKGCPMHRGEKIGMLYHAANHDEKVFSEPYRLDLARENADKHLSFGIGRHNCLGATLARLELKIVLERLVKDYQRITIHDKVRIRSNFINGLKTMKTELHSL
jgi:cytochrome P450